MDPTPAVWVCETPDDDPRWARTTLLAVAARVAGGARGSLRLEHEGTGRPVVRGAGPDLRASLSHGRAVVAVALSGAGDVGVDVERVRSLPAVRLARRWLSPAAADWVAARAPAQRDAAFLWLWTQKEAVGKARGTGLTAGLLRAPVTLPDRWPVGPGGLTPRPVPGDPAIAVAAGPAGPGVLVALAHVGPPVAAPVPVHQLPFSEL
ncbi:MAG TPA: 4'-phosphopantetheinyl transferase superfamily protein [Pilimelia sp.]|nr:4'-phosphopantetheinyl transferase superfamily protein [Pilimelia sp.]